MQFSSTEACITNCRTSLYLETAATLCTDRGGETGGGKGGRAISSRGRLQSDYYMPCIMSPPFSLSLSLSFPLLRVSTYSAARNTIDESGASGISKRMQFKREQNKAKKLPGYRERSRRCYARSLKLKIKRFVAHCEF